VGRNPAELDELMLFKALGKLNLVKLLESIDRIAEGEVVLLFDVEAIEGLVDGLDVQVLDGKEVGLDKGKVSIFEEDSHNSAVIDFGGENLKKVVEEGGVSVIVKVDHLGERKGSGEKRVV